MSREIGAKIDRGKWPADIEPLRTERPLLVEIDVELSADLSDTRGGVRLDVER